MRAAPTCGWAGRNRPRVEPWWRVSAGEKWFSNDDSVILGCDAAEIELRSPGELFFSPETGRKFRVAGVLERSGTER